MTSNPFNFDYDFDLASKAWLSNKIYIGNGTYIYRKSVTKCIKNPRILIPSRHTYNLRSRNTGYQKSNSYNMRSHSK